VEPPVVFLFLGKLLPAKGVDLLLAAWGAGIPGAELWIAGTGPLDDRVAAAASADRTVHDRTGDGQDRAGSVRALGWLDETARRTALAAASVLVLPSTWPENFPLSAAEGILAGLPVLSTTVAAPPVVVEGETGLLVEAEAESLRAGMVALLDGELRRRLASGARAAAAELDFDAHAARIEAQYESPLSARQHA
jgi:glycosyltransferase involved in cell wall biosynthesis